MALFLFDVIDSVEETPMCAPFCGWSLVVLDRRAAELALPAIPEIAHEISTSIPPMFRHAVVSLSEGVGSDGHHYGEAGPCQQEHPGISLAPVHRVGAFV